MAIDLVSGIVVDGLLKEYYAAASMLDAMRASGAQLLAMLGNLAGLVARVFYYLANLAPFSRGSPAAIMMLHHAMWMRLASSKKQRQVLQCLGLWRNGSYPLEECLIVRHASDRFTRHLYGTLLEHPSVRSPEELAKCMAAVLRKESTARPAAGEL
uniref:Uncharacterized protein n=1 Tax=Pyrodinium bahamense TaxID=73915 RepID=A0A7S0AUQ7_9DINO